MAATGTTISNPEPSIIPGLDYDLVTDGDRSPQLRHPNKIDHKNLQVGKYYYILDIESEAERRRRERSERGLGLPVPAVPIVIKYIGKLIRMPRQDQLNPDGSINYALYPPEYKQVLEDGRFDTLPYEIDEFDEVYLCKNIKCQDTGAGHSEQAGGRSRSKRYPKTKKRSSKHSKYSKKSRVRKTRRS